MRPTQKELREAIIAAIRACLAVPYDEEITDETDTARHLGLDSEDGIPLCILLSEKLDYDIPHHINPLFDDDRHRMRRVGEIIELVSDLIANEQEAKHG